MLTKNIIGHQNKQKGLNKQVKLLLWILFSHELFTKPALHYINYINAWCKRVNVTTAKLITINVLPKFLIRNVYKVIFLTESTVYFSIPLSTVMEYLFSKDFNIEGSFSDLAKAVIIFTPWKNSLARFVSIMKIPQKIFYSW